MKILVEINEPYMKKAKVSVNLSVVGNDATIEQIKEALIYALKATMESEA
jgi:hypothetical protein